MASKDTKHTKHKLARQIAGSGLLAGSFIFCLSVGSEPQSKSSTLLVPPPPPVVIPSGFNVNIPINMYTPVEYLTEDQLKTTRQDVVTRLEAAHSELVEKEEHSDELKKRAQLFTSLIEEGVVSRRELQTAERESKTAEQEFLSAQDTAKTLETELSRIDSQLARIAKKKTPTPAKSKKKK